MLLINKKVNIQNKKIKGVETKLKRIWLEGKKLARIVSAGTPMFIQDKQDGIVVKFNHENAQRTVSQRTTSNSTVPLIEISESNSEFLKSISEDTILRIAVTSKGIRITPNMEVVSNRINERESRLINKLANGDKLEIGSIFAGGGTFDYCGAQGFEKAKLATVVRMAIDFDSSAVENLASNCGHIFDEKSLLIESDISLLNFDRSLPKLDILKITPPCVDASRAGKAKKGNIVETSKTAHLVYYYSQLIDKCNPSYIMFENVPEFQYEASFLVVKGLIESFGYKTQLRIIDANKEGFALETRKRMFMVAESEGLVGNFDINEVSSLRSVPVTLQEVLDDVPTEHSSWKAKTGLIEKQERDKANGKGFRMQVFTGEESYIGTIRSQYQKSGSSDPLIVNKESGKFRIINGKEHARVKNIDEAFIDGLSDAQAHKILGNGLIGSVAESLCFFLAKAIKSINVIDMVSKRVQTVAA